MSYKETGLFKDYFSREVVLKLGETIRSVHRGFDVGGFVQTVCDDSFFGSELKDRIRRIAAALKQHLPVEYNKSTEILMKAAPRLSGFENWTLTTYVEHNGTDHFDQSVKAMKTLTQHGTAEFAIRPFMINHTTRMLKVVNEWAVDENEHVRRLAAEGTRPRGVWMPHVETFKKDPRPVIKLLGKLKNDPSLYVRKAVANNLNDISKDNPDLVIETGRKWLKGATKETQWIIRHACRTLIKQGHPEVFELLGFTAKPKIKLTSLSITPKQVRRRSQTRFEFIVTSLARTEQKLAVDYRVHYVKAGNKSSPKVFKLSEIKLRPGQKLDLSGRISFKPITTRKYYAGQHRLDIMVNGANRASAAFTLINGD